MAELQEEQFLLALMRSGYVHEHMKAIMNNDPDSTDLRLGFDIDTKQLSTLGWELLGRYIANNNHLTTFQLSTAIDNKNLAALFQETRKNKSIKELDLHSSSMGVDGLQCVIPFLENSTQLTSLNLSTNQVGTEGFELLVNALNRGPIEELILDCCGIESIAALENCTLPKFHKLVLNANRIEGNSISALERHTTLKILCMRYNQIGIDGCTAIAGLLRGEDTSLTELDLEYNNINDEGVELIAVSLKENIALETLRLENKNDIAEKGHVALLKLVNDVSSIENTYKSNHTLLDITFPRHPSKRDTICECTNLRWRIFDTIRINRSGSNPGREKVILTQLKSVYYDKGPHALPLGRIESCRMQGIPCTSHNSLYAQIDPVVLPDVLSLVGERCSVNDMYCGLLATVPDLVSLINKPAVLKERMNDVKKQITNLTTEYNQKVRALFAEINELNEELQMITAEGGYLVSLG